MLPRALHAIAMLFVRDMHAQVQTIWHVGGPEGVPLNKVPLNAGDNPP